MKSVIGVHTLMASRHGNLLYQSLALVLAVMHAQIFLYVFARIYERICACRTVSLRETRTAVREWAC